jgi:hypothetical protein
MGAHAALQGNICTDITNYGGKFRSIHTELYSLPDDSDTRLDTSAHSPVLRITTPDDVYIDSGVPMQKIIPQISEQEVTVVPCLDEKAQLRSVSRLGDLAGTCEDVPTKLRTILPILEGCLAETCDKWENCKSISSIGNSQASISSIDTSQASIAHGAKTDSDLARPPGGCHPAAQRASQEVSFGA